MKLEAINEIVEKITKAKVKVVFNEEEQSMFNTFISPKQQFIRNFICYRQIRDNRNCIMVLKVHNYWLTKFLLIHLREHPEWHLDELKKAVQKDFRKMCEIKFSKHNKSIEETLNSKDKFILKKVYGGKGTYKLCAPIIRGGLLLMLRPTILHYKMLYSKKSHNYYIIVSPTKVGKFLGFIFENEMKENGYRITN